MKSKNHSRGALVIFLAVLLMISCFAMTASAKTYRLTIGFGPPADPLPFLKPVRDFWCVEVAKRVEKATDHKIEWNFAFGGGVAKLGDEFESVKSGLLDIGIVFPIFENPELFLHNFGYFAPFGSSDIELATKVNLNVYDNNPWLKDVFHQKYNQKWVGLFTYEGYELITKFPVKSLEDLENHKIAAAGPNLPWIKRIGCVPVQSSLAEAYIGLQTGVYDGWVMTPSYTWGYKLYEVAPYLTYVGFGCISAGSLTVNLDVWRSLPKKVQDIMMEVGREYSYVVAKATQAKAELAVKDMKEKGIKFYTITQEEKRKWLKLISDLATQKAKEADKFGQPGTQVMKYYVDEMAAAGYEWPIRWIIK